MTTAAALRPDVAAPPPSPATVERPRRRWLAALAISVVLGIACGLSIWGTSVELGGAIGSRAFWWALLFAAVPVPFLVALFWWLDRLRPEPSWLLLTALLYGAFLSTYASLLLNTWLADLVGDPAGTTPRAAVFVAPWVEEAAKALIVFALVIWRRHDFNAVVAGVVYGGLAGVGFAFTENIIYYGQLFQLAVNAGADGGQALDAVQELFVVRGLAAPFVHPMFTLVTGIGVGLAVRHRHVGVRILAPVAGYCGAVLLHMGYNALASFTRPQHLVAVYLCILIPSLIVLVTVVVLTRRHERRVIGARLQDYATFGWLTPDQLPYIVIPARRRQARRHVRQLGKAERERLRTFQRTGVELGVLRDRLVRGVAGQQVLGRERTLIATMRSLRGRVMLPSGAEPDHRRITTTASSW